MGFHKHKIISVSVSADTAFNPDKMGILQEKQAPFLMDPNTYVTPAASRHSEPELLSGDAALAF